MRVAHHYHHPLLFEAIIVMQQLISIRIIKTYTVTGRWCNTILLSHINHMMYESLVYNILLVDNNFLLGTKLAWFVCTIYQHFCHQGSNRFYKEVWQCIINFWANTFRFTLTRPIKFNVMLYFISSPAIEFSMLYLKNHLFRPSKRW